jgi:hypothetical protein
MVNQSLLRTTFHPQRKEPLCHMVIAKTIVFYMIFLVGRGTWSRVVSFFSFGVFDGTEILFFLIRITVGNCVRAP